LGFSSTAFPPDALITGGLRKGIISLKMIVLLLEDALSQKKMVKPRKKAII
jgi:hypothetical protein